MNALPEDLVIVELQAPGTELVGYDKFTEQWCEAMDWFLVCGGTPEEWWDLSFAGRAVWIYSVAELERKVRG